MPTDGTIFAASCYTVVLAHPSLTFRSLVAAAVQIMYIRDTFPLAEIGKLGHALLAYISCLFPGVLGPQSP